MCEHYVYGDHPERRAERRVEVAGPAAGDARRGRERGNGERDGRWRLDDDHRRQRIVILTGTIAEYHPLPSTPGTQLYQRRGSADDELVRRTKRSLILE